MRTKLLIPMIVFLCVILGASILLGNMETETSYADNKVETEENSTLIYNNFDLVIS